MADAASATHLDEAVRGLLLLDDGARIARIDRDLWIGYGRARDALARLERLLRSERRQRPDNLLVVGPSNNGKTMVARRFAGLHAVPEDPLAERASVPVALVQAPNGARLQPMLEAVLAALGGRPGRRETTARLRTEAHAALRAAGTRLVLIDDLHNVRGPGVASMLVELRELGTLTGVSLGAFATRDIVHVLRLDEQLANRFEPFLLPRWTADDPDYPRLLQTFARRLPLREPSDLTEPALAARILTLAEGLIGGVAAILRAAAVEAVRSGRERIDRPLLDRIGFVPPSALEGFAAARNL